MALRADVQKFGAKQAHPCFQHAAAPGAQVMEGLFLFCCVWSLGACLVQRADAKERERFDAFLRGIAAMGTIDSEWCAAPEGLGWSRMPARGATHPYANSLAGAGHWGGWLGCLEQMLSQYTHSITHPGCRPASCPRARCMSTSLTRPRAVGAPGRARCGTAGRRDGLQPPRRLQCLANDCRCAAKS